MSIFYGTLILTYAWVAINAILMKLLEVEGHIVIIFAGIPLLSFLVYKIREQRIDILLQLNIEKVQYDIEALIQIHHVTDFSKSMIKNQNHEITLIGIINIHILEC